jgi:hypothetical protein
MNKLIVAMFSFGVLVSSILFAQQPPSSPKKLTKIAPLFVKTTKGSRLSDDPSMAYAYIAPEERNLITWLGSEKTRIAIAVKAGKILVKDRPNLENDADFTYFKCKYGDVAKFDFQAMKDLILSNGYADITEVLASVGSLDIRSVPYANGSATSFISITNFQIAALSLNYFSKITQITPIARLAGLDYLSINGSPIADGCFETLRNLTGLRTLYFSRNNISDLRGIDAFRKLEHGGVMAGKIAQYAKITVLDRLFSLSPGVLSVFYINENPLNYNDPQFQQFVALHPQVKYQ